MNKNTEYFPYDVEIERKRKQVASRRQFLIPDKKMKLSDVKFYCPPYIAALI